MDATSESTKTTKTTKGRKRAPKAPPASVTSSAAISSSPGSGSNASSSSRVTVAAMKSALGRLIHVVDRASSIPALHHVSIRRAEDALVLTTTDLTMSLAVRVPVTGAATAMDTTADCKRLLAMVKVMPNGEATREIEMASDARELKLSCAAVSARLPTGVDRDFPKTPVHDGQWHALDAAPLHALIDTTLFSVCKDPTRVHLCGALLKCGGGVLCMVSTDGHRLSKAQRSCKTTFTTRERSVIIPDKALRELNRLLDDSPCEIAIKGPHLFVRQGDWTMSVRLVDSQYPPYEQVIPRDFKVLVTIDRALLIESAKRSRMVAENRGVIVRLQDGVVTLTANDGDGGEFRETVAADYIPKGGVVAIGLNPSFLIDTLEHVDGDHVVIGMSMELDPIVIRSIDDAAMRHFEDAEFVGVIMPVRM